ncbi:MAG: HIT domain-containing protein [Chromatiaceae bacterium]|nr:HIT domain-containing protein [Chromatiaceae bacterium]MBP8196983.1 HIT domain-containing protein [Chromatiaceae bacterium]MBP8282871.1 HIT domain-containing protein [Chromatiaceae bacterium]
MHSFPLHPQLLADCHRLGQLSHGHLLLHRNALVPWFILVPETNLGNLLDLPIPQRDGVLADCKRVSDYLTGVLDCPKVNVAWIGNLVPQLHVHLIGRHPDDPCWPKPVWGNLTQSRDYGAQEVGAIRAALLDI